MTLTIGQMLDRVFDPGTPVRFTAYDGSSAGDPDSRFTIHLANERAVRYIATAPGELGLARAYVAGDLSIEGADPGDPYDLLRTFRDEVEPHLPKVPELPDILKSLGLKGLRPPELPPQETPAPWRRMVHGLRHSKARDADAIHHHYDVSNRFYEILLGPSMTYTCACYPTVDATLEEAQANKYDLVCRKLGLQPGMRLLDVGCGWGGMVRHAVKNYGVTALGVTLSDQQARWAAKAIAEDGISERAEVRHLDYRDVTETGFDAVSSIGLTEHIGVRNYPGYFRFLKARLREGGRLLNHCITRTDNRHPGISRGGFIDRYVFPDGELTGSGSIITVMQDVGFEVRHAENLREHYAMTTRDWCRNLSAGWDEAVAEVGPGTAKVWGLYLAGSRLSFEENSIQLHQVLGVKVGADGDAHMPIRPTWAS